MSPYNYSIYSKNDSQINMCHILKFLFIFLTFNLSAKVFAITDNIESLSNKTTAAGDEIFAAEFVEMLRNTDEKIQLYDGGGISKRRGSSEVIRNRYF